MLFFVKLLSHLFVFFTEMLSRCSMAAVLGRPSSSRPNFFVLVLPRPIMLQETILTEMSMARTDDDIMQSNLNKAERDLVTRLGKTEVTYASMVCKLVQIQSTTR